MATEQFVRKRKNWDIEDLIWTVSYITEQPIQNYTNLTHYQLEAQLAVLGKMGQHPPNKQKLIG